MDREGKQQRIQRASPKSREKFDRQPLWRPNQSRQSAAPLQILAQSASWLSLTGAGQGRGKGKVAKGKVAPHDCGIEGTRV